MHMSDALISPIVGGSLYLASTGVMGYSIKKIKQDMTEKKIPLMGVMGAFLFAAQMINFSIPGTGSSGHIGGGMLLAIILGPSAGFLTMACVLLIQALFFADGGLIAYGCNLFNLGFFTCYIAYPLIYAKIVAKGLSKRKIFWGALIASVIGLQLGSFGVVIETFLSGRSELSLGTFLLFMQPIHLAIGVIEGIITATIVVYVYQQNAQMMYAQPVAETFLSTNDVLSTTKTWRSHSSKIILRFFVGALILGGVLSLFASSSPDGLEWAIEKTTAELGLEVSSPLVLWFEEMQLNLALLPDYGFKSAQGSSGELVGTSASGIIGSLITLSLTIVLGRLIRKNRKRKAAIHE